MQNNGTRYTGGIIGLIWGGGQADVKNCYNAGNLISTPSFAGGICGRVLSEKTASAASGNTSILKIYNSYNVGEITATEYANAIVGWIGSDTETTLDNCYYLSNMNSGEYAVDNSVVVGSSTKKESLEMKAESFVNLLNSNNEDTIWIKDINNRNNGYPILNW